MLSYLEKFLASNSFAKAKQLIQNPGDILDCFKIMVDAYFFFSSPGEHEESPRWHLTLVERLWHHCAKPTMNASMSQ
jgi:hypothetical protein